MQLKMHGQPSVPFWQIDQGNSRQDHKNNFDLKDKYKKATKKIKRFKADKTLCNVIRKNRRIPTWGITFSSGTVPRYLLQLRQLALDRFKLSIPFRRCHEGLQQAHGRHWSFLHRVHQRALSHASLTSSHRSAGFSQRRNLWLAGSYARSFP